VRLEVGGPAPPIRKPSPPNRCPEEIRCAQCLRIKSPKLTTRMYTIPPAPWILDGTVELCRWPNRDYLPAALRFSPPASAEWESAWRRGEELFSAKLPCCETILLQSYSQINPVSMRSIRS